MTGDKRYLNGTLHIWNIEIRHIEIKKSSEEKVAL